MRRFPAKLFCATLLSISATGTAGAAPFLYLSDDTVPGHVFVVDVANGEVAATIPMGGNARVIGLNADQTQLFVTSVLDGTMSQIDTRTNSIIRTFPYAQGASEIATTSQDPSRAYLVRGAITVLDTSTGTVLQTLTVPAQYLGYFVDVQVSPDGNRLYASDYFDGKVFVYDAHSYALISTIAGMSDPTTLAISPDGSQLYVVSFISRVYIIDTTSFGIVSSVDYFSGGGTDADEMVASPDGNFVYVANINNNRVAKIDLRDYTVTNIAVSGRPYGLSVSADGRHIYARMYTGEVQVLSRDANAVVGTFAPIFNRANERNFVGEPPASAYVGNGAANHLSIIHSDSDTTVAGAELGATANGIAVSADGVVAYVSERSNNSVAFVNVLTNTKFNSVTVGQSPGPLAVSADGRRVYVANQADKSVSEIDVATNSVTAIPLGFVAGTPTGIAVSPDDMHVYVAAGRVVAVIDPSARAGSAPTYLDQYGSVCGIAVAADGQSLFVTLDEDDLLRQLALPTNATVGEVYVGPSGPLPTHYNPCALALSPDSERAYVANSAANSLSIVDNVLHDLVSVVAVGTNPGAVSVTPDDRYIYVANTASDSVSVIDGATLALVKTLTGFSKPDAIGNIVAPSQEIFSNGFE